MSSANGRGPRRRRDQPADIITPTDEVEIAALLEGETNPWNYMEVIKTRVPMNIRAGYYERWENLVVERPFMEQDALLAEGQPVFRYTMPAVREALKKRNKEQAGDTRAVATVGPEQGAQGFLAEMIYRRGETPPTGFLVHRFDEPDASPEFIDRIKIGSITYLPLAGYLADLNIVKFPSAVEDFGTDTELFLRIRDLISRTVYMRDTQFRDLACCYVMMSWVFDRFEALPYLRAQGDIGTGKTRFLQAFGSLCFRPVLTGGATTAAPIFRIIDRVKGTLVIDEADFDRSEIWAEILKILNSGYSREFPVLRAERGPDGFDVRAYDCYGPKLLASRNRFIDAALESRCLTYVTPFVPQVGDQYPLVLGPEFRREVQQLRNMLLYWRMRRFQTVELDDSIRQADIEPRVMQIIQPVVSVTKEPALRDTILALTVGYNRAVQAERRDSPEGLVATALLRRWIDKRCPVRFQMKEVASLLKEDDDLGNLTNRRIGSIIRRTLNLNDSVQTIGGMSYVFLTFDLADGINVRYGLQFNEALAQARASAKEREAQAKLPPAPRRQAVAARSSSVVP